MKIFTPLLINSSFKASPNASWVINLICCSTIIRLIIAYYLEIENNEQYYQAFAIYPEVNAFDHAPIIEAVIRLFSTSALSFDKLALRVSSILFAAANTWVIYRIGFKIKGEMAGWYASLFYTFSIYGSLIAGILVIPEAAQLFFWLLSLNLMLDFLPAVEIDTKLRAKIILFGFTVGFAMLSKYSSAFIWLSVIFYVILYNSKWLLEYSFHFAFLISLLFILPVINWKSEFDWPGLSILVERISLDQISLSKFLYSTLDQIWYTNPVNFFVIVIPFISLFGHKCFIRSAPRIILLLTCLPLYGASLFFLLFKIKWLYSAGPVFVTLSIIAAIYWSEKVELGTGFAKKRFIMLYILVGSLFIGLYISGQMGHHNDDDPAEASFAEFGFINDSEGWGEIGNSFKKIAEREESSGLMRPKSDLISIRNFPCAHEEFYVARPMNRKLFLIPDMDDSSTLLINKINGGLADEHDYYYISINSMNQKDDEILKEHFVKIELVDTIKINDRKAFKFYDSYALVYRLKHFHQVP